MKPISHQSEATIVETENGEMRANVSFPTSFCGHSYAVDFFQNRESSVPPGPYHIEFVLGTEFMLHEMDLAGSPDNGYSYLTTVPDLQSIGIFYQSPPGSSEPKKGSIYPRSESGRIKSLVVDIPELDIDASVNISSTLVHSILDVIALRRGVPIQIHHIDVRKEVGDNRFMRRYLLLPYKPCPLLAEDLQNATTIPEALRPALRLFREGLNSSNPHYRFLCLYRVREALEKVITQNNAIFHGKGKTPLRKSHRVPDNELTQKYFPDLVGKKLNAFLDHVRVKYRIPVAHVSFDELDRMLLDPANIRVSHGVDAANAVLIDVARVLIEDEWKLMSDEGNESIFN